MNVLSQKKRIDEVEISLTAKEWAIQLLGAMRRHEKEEEFWKAAANSEFEECMLTKPLLKLMEQAQARCPGQNLQAKEARAELSRRLRREFQELKILILTTNEAVRKATRMSSHLRELSWSLLAFVILEKRVKDLTHAMRACIRRMGQDRSNFADVMGLLAAFRNENPPTSALTIQTSADALALMLTSLLEHEAGVNIIQERYFGGHPVLFLENENALKENIKGITRVIRMFQRCFSFRQRGRFRLIQKKFESIDVEELHRRAKASATRDIMCEEAISYQDEWHLARATLKADFQTYAGSMTKKLIKELEQSCPEESLRSH